MSAHAVITTINPPSPAVTKLARTDDIKLTVVGDYKTPKDWALQGALYLSPEYQLGLGFRYGRHAPTHHYARKNFGYLQAMREKASVIYDTDDDNIPNDNWRIRQVEDFAHGVEGEGWCNALRLLGAKSIWPRGFPLQEIHTDQFSLQKPDKFHSPIQQGLANGSPDVDAIWRLVMAGYLEGSGDMQFTLKGSVALSASAWCPFNSQSTWWFPEAYPLMYLPKNVSFRMTDIWRSLVAQRCLWAMDYPVMHHSPAEVDQERNPHNLLKDFEDEVDGYLHNHRIAEILDKLTLSHDDSASCVCFNLRECYVALVDAGIVEDFELAPLEAWIQDILDIL